MFVMCMPAFEPVLFTGQEIRFLPVELFFADPDNRKCVYPKACFRPEKTEVYVPKIARAARKISSLMCSLERLEEPGARSAPAKKLPLAGQAEKCFFADGVVLTSQKRTGFVVDRYCVAAQRLTPLRPFLFSQSPTPPGAPFVVGLRRRLAKVWRRERRRPPPAR